MGQVVEIIRRGNRASSNKLLFPLGEIDPLGRETCACCFTVTSPKADIKNRAENYRLVP